MRIGEYVKQYCKSHGLSQRQYAELCGLSSAYISMLINERNPKTGLPITVTIETYKSLAKGMKMDVEELFENIEDAPILLPQKQTSNIAYIAPSDIKHHKIPIIGSVAGGEPIYDEDFDLFIDGPAKATCAVRLKGKSMEPLYMDGDIIYIREQPDVRDGEVAVVFVGDEAVLKRVYHMPNGLQLLSENPKFKPIMATVEEYDSIRILGIPCGFTRMYNNGAINIK